jgi:hypothetical protein
LNNTASTAGVMWGTWWSTGTAEVLYFETRWIHCKLLCMPLPTLLLTVSYLCALGNISQKQPKLNEIGRCLWMKMADFWDVAPRSLVEVYGRFRGICCLHHQGDDDGGSKDLWNVGKLLPDYTVLQPRRQQSSCIELFKRYFRKGLWICFTPTIQERLWRTFSLTAFLCVTSGCQGN